MSFGNSVTDEELVIGINAGNDLFLPVLFNRYSGFIDEKAEKFHSCDKEDLLQEGLIALYSAVKIYDSSLSSFKTFAHLCIERRILSAGRRIFQKKQVPANQLVSLEDDFNECCVATPESVIIEKEECEQFIEKIKNNLSTFEYSVLLNYLAGNTYEQISVKLGVEVKAVNNAMFRLRKKIKDFH